MQTQKTIEVLNNLVAVSEDGMKGFSEAAGIATDAKLKLLFRQCAHECEESIGELQQLVTGMGGSPSQSGSVAGAAHRGWLKMKSSVEDKNIAVLEEVERGQDHAKAAYSKALRTVDLTLAARGLVERQAAGTRRNHDQVRDLRNAYKAAAMAA